MKFIYVIGVFFVLTSCTKFLIGEKKLTYDKLTPYIKTSISKEYYNYKFYVIPSIEMIKKCRGYPYFYYLGSENKYSFFHFHGKLKHKDEITLFALPDSICIIKYPNTIDDEIKIYNGNRHATIVDNKIVVVDN